MTSLEQMMPTEELELYDPLENKSTLTLYLIKEGEKWVPIESKELVIGKQLTRLLQFSHDSRPLLKRKVKVGERLTYHVKKEGSPWKTYLVTPSDWVVVNVFRYEADLSEIKGDLPEFRDVQIAYCDRQPLTPEEAEAMTYEIVSKVSADSFGGDKEAYQQFLASQQSDRYVRV
ncbi:MAG: hypothetical protein ACRC62_38720 [Microcoleus sp.]